MKILVLSCSTGEGHNSAAKAVIEALVSCGVECELLDPIIFKSEKRMKFVANLYNSCISKMPWFFGIVYKAGQLYDASPLPSPVAYANSKYAKPLSEYVIAGGYDAVIATHIFAMAAMDAVRKKHGVNIPVYTVITDYTVIPFHTDSIDLDCHFVPTESEKKTLVKKGFDPEKIEISGIPTSPKFSLPITKSEAKARLGIEEDKRIVSILSGGAGCGKLTKLCRKMSKALDDGHHIYVFSGKNEKLRDKLRECFADDKKITVIDFTPDVNIYTKASDVVLSKPGGLSSTEIVNSNVPFVHLKAIPGCESCNIKYFTKQGISLPGKSIRSAVKQTVKLLSDTEAAENMMARQRECIPNNSALFIAQKVLKDLGKTE